MNTKEKFQGILVPVVSPISKSGELDYNAYSELIEKLFKTGIHGLYTCGMTGDCLLLRLEERKRAAEIASTLCKKHKRLCIVHAGALSTRDSIELVAHAASLGVDAVSAMPIAGISSANLKAYYETLAGIGSDVPLLVYYIPALSRMIPMEEMLDILRIENVFGLKFSDEDFFYMKRLLLHLDDITVFNGNDEVLTYGLLNGADGGIGMTYNIFPELFLRIYDYVKCGNTAAALKLQDALAVYLDKAVTHGIRESVEYTCARRFGSMKCFRPPNCIGILSADVKRELDTAADYILSLAVSVK